jgi:formylglycine-generating enzyme required for sulfatase activity
MIYRHQVAAILLSAGILYSHHAVAANRMLAVLPLDTRMTQGEMTDGARASLEEMIRDSAINLLAASGWTVLTGETTLQILLDNGIDPAKCADQSCHLSIAREINAQKFVSGVVQFAEGEFTASVRLIDTKTGRIVSTERLNGRTVKAMREDFAPRAQSFFARGGLTEEVPVAAQPDRTKETGGTVKIISNPPGATVVIDGVVMGRTPWNKPMVPGTYYVGLEFEGYQPVSRSVAVEAGKEATVFERLQAERGFIHVAASGFINVMVTPADAVVTIDGRPAGVGQQGPLSDGKHVVRVEAPGYAPREKAIMVQNGETVAATMVLSPISGTLMLSVNVDADCEVQNKRVRATPIDAETLNLASGTNRIVCRAPGYEDAVRNVMVESGETLFVHMSLSPKSQAIIRAPPPSRFNTSTSVPGLYIEKSRPRSIQIETESLTNDRDSFIEVRSPPRAQRQDYLESENGFDVKPRVRTTRTEVTAAPPPTQPRELDFVRISGASSRCNEDEEDCDSATSSARPFLLTRSLISAEEYAQCVRAGVCAEPKRGGRCTWGSGRSDQAVNCVDWQQAKQFCEWSGARLPSMEEWELAAGANQPKVDKRIADPGEFRGNSDEVGDMMSMDALDQDGRGMAKGVRTTLSRAARQVLVKILPQTWEWTATSSGSKRVLTGLVQTNSPWPSPSRRYSSMTFMDEAVGFRCAQ